MTDRVLKTEDLDRLGQAVLTLTKELWVLKDRQRILEAALADKGMLEPGAVDAHEPDEQLADALSAERRQLINDVLDTLNTPPLNAPHR